MYCAKNHMKLNILLVHFFLLPIYLRHQRDPSSDRRLVKTTTTALRQDRHDTPPTPHVQRGVGGHFKFQIFRPSQRFWQGTRDICPTHPPSLPPPPSPPPPPYVRPPHIQKKLGKKFIPDFLGAIQYSTVRNVIWTTTIFLKKYLFKKIKLFFLLNLINFNHA